MLVATSNYLKIPHCENKNKNQLSHLILCRIQNLLPDDCGLCKNRYSVKLDDSPLLECAICGQGVHEECWLNLLSVASAASDYISDKSNVIRKCVNPFKLPGIFYICTACEESTIPKEDNMKTKNVAAVNPEPVACGNQHAESTTKLLAEATQSEVAAHNDEEVNISEEGGIKDELVINNTELPEFETDNHATPE